MLVTESKILILGMKGIFFCRGRKITKFDFFMFKDSLLAFSHSLTLPSSRLTSVSSSFRLLFARKRKRKVRKNRACPFRQIQIPIVDLVNSLLKRILVLTEHETGQTTKGYIPLHKFNRNSLLSLFTHSALTPLFE